MPNVDMDASVMMLDCAAMEVVMAMATKEYVDCHCIMTVVQVDWIARRLPPSAPLPANTPSVPTDPNASMPPFVTTMVAVETMAVSVAAMIASMVDSSATTSPHFVLIREKGGSVPMAPSVWSTRSVIRRLPRRCRRLSRLLSRHPCQHPSRRLCHHLRLLHWS